MIRNQKGQTLIEVLVGLATAVVVLSAITTATITAINNAEYSRNQNLAANYAQQGIEELKNMHDTQYATFSSFSGTYCFAKTCNSLNSTSGGSCGPQSNNRCPNTLNVDGFFIRQAVFDVGNANSQVCNEAPANSAVKATVYVYWNDNKCTNRSNLYCHSVSISSCFSDALVPPTP